MSKYLVTAPLTPGATPSSQPADTLDAARKIARKFFRRADLCGTDVRIEKSDGQLIEYAGPAR